MGVHRDFIIRSRTVRFIGNGRQLTRVSEVVSAAVRLFQKVLHRLVDTVALHNWKKMQVRVPLFRRGSHTYNPLSSPVDCQLLERLPSS